jgi:hypothetical protein
VAHRVWENLHALHGVKGSVETLGMVMVGHEQGNKTGIEQAGIIQENIRTAMQESLALGDEIVGN